MVALRQSASARGGAKKTKTAAKSARAHPRRKAS
jgi:hypothetical protein